MPDHDVELMQRAAQGEECAFRELFDRHYARAVNIAYRCTGDRDLAEDLAMDAFARIYESRTRYRPRARFTTFLYRVVVNLCLNSERHRRTAREEALDENTLVAASDDPSESVERAELGEAVRAAMLALPANQRMSMVLTRYEQMSYAEAAEAMDVSVGALESLLQRAKVSLRKRLSGYLHG